MTAPAPVSNSNGSQTCTIGTEHSLVTISAGGYYQLKLDVNAIVDGDTLFINVYGKVRSSDTERLMDTYSISHSQNTKIVNTDAYMVTDDITFKIKQTAGTGRAIPWQIDQA